MKVPCVIIAVICSLIAVSEQASLVGNSDNQKDKFRALVLGNGEAPAYTIVDRRAPNIELRSYYPAVTAVSFSFIANTSALSESDISIEFARQQVKLDVYYAGYNNATLFMPTTGVQISSFIRTNANAQLADFGQEFGAWNGSMLIASQYYVSPAFYAALPLPNDRTVNVIGEEENLRGVLTFGGYANAENVLRFRRQLIDAFPEANATNTVFSAFQVWSFDPWWKFWNRRNEIHVLSNDGKDPITIY